MKSVAILLDGGFVEHRLHRLLGGKHPTATQLAEFGRACLHEDEELFRIYYYDCPPYDKKQQHPIGKDVHDFAASDTYRRKSRLHRELALKDGVAFRQGRLTFDGWKLSRKAMMAVETAAKSKTSYSIAAEDLSPDIKQKCVDMKIGLDIAWLASKQIVDRLLLVTGDSDFVPAMKFARREGIQVVLIPLGATNLSTELKIHADEVRTVSYPPV